jgi:hypothetical protein
MVSAFPPLKRRAILIRPLRGLFLPGDGSSGIRFVDWFMRRGYIGPCIFASSAPDAINVYAMIDLHTLNSKSFAEQLHSRFTVRAGEAAPQTLELIEVSEPPTPPHIEFFSLQFRGPVTPRLQQQIHRFEHEKMGTFDLFLTVIGADETGTTYEVIFHRLRQKQP